MNRTEKAYQRKVRSFYQTLFKLVGVCAALACIITALVVVKRERQRSVFDRIVKVRAILDSYHESARARRRDDWWMTTAPNPPTPEWFRLLQDKKEHIVELIKDGRNTTSDTRLIASRFEDVQTTLYVNGRPMAITTNGQPEPANPKSINVCFLPKDVAVSLGFMGPVWSSELQAVVIPAVNVPDGVYAALLFHELGHAYRHNRYDGDPKVADDSDGYIQEEVEMHMLTGDMLDHKSKGLFRRRIDAILSRSSKAVTFDEVLAEITAEDFEEVDAMFGCSNTDVPDTLLVSQTALEVAFEFCDRHNLGMQGKIAAYRWFERNIFTIPQGSSQ